jgi:glycosyltransferase involved in cell wall biosynthesis
MSPTDIREIRNVGFVSTRISGTDGVSLEIDKWATILERLGYDCFYVCGKSDRPADRTYLIEEADFRHPAIREINSLVLGRQHRSRELSHTIHRLTRHIKDQLYEAIDHFHLDLLVAQNALTIPLNVPLGAALVEVIIESGIPCIAHHHDFVWERERYLINAVDDYLQAAFPPRLSEIEHVVINSLAGEEFSRRTGLPHRIIPNVMDFANPPSPPDDYAADFRENIGVAPDDLLILQPTRIVARKGIEHSIELVRRLTDLPCKLVVTHGGMDEGDGYLERIRDFARLMGVEMILADRWISDKRGVATDGRKQYAIWDVYPHADLVAYPSTYEGFGNAFLEAAYYKKPIFCNRYTIFRTDIEPCGFRAVVMDGFLTADVVQQIRRVLDDTGYRNEMVDHNYQAASRFFSYQRVETELTSILRKLSPVLPC